MDSLLLEKGLLETKNCDGHECIRGGCQLGKSHMTFLPEGKFYACRRFESPIGNIWENFFFSAFFGKKMSEYRNMEKIEGCKDCKFLRRCKGCLAVAFGTTGNYFAKDPQYWISA